MRRVPLLKVFPALLLLAACGERESARLSWPRQDGLGVVHTVCQASAPMAPCEYASPAACAVGTTVTNGDICLVYGGEYHETVTYEIGKLKSALIFRCAPGFPCLVDGDQTRANGFYAYYDWVIEGFEVTGTTGDAIAAYSQVSGVRDCFIHDVRGRGITGVNGTSTSTAYVEGNVIANTVEHGITCAAFGAGPIVVRNNLVLDSSLGATGIGIYCATNNAVTYTVEHNTVDVRNRTLPWADPAPNGILAKDVRFNVVAGGVTGLSASVARAHNLVWAWSGTPYGGTGDAGNPVTDLTGDPLFAGPEDWRLTADSPAIDAGVGSTLTTDLDGLPRDVLPYLGAWEFDAAHVPAPLVREKSTSAAPEGVNPNPNDGGR